MLSVQRTSRSFDARFSACARTYHYYLPLDILCPSFAGVTFSCPQLIMPACKEIRISLA